jgi:hypothetical protein
MKREKQRFRRASGFLALTTLAALLAGILPDHTLAQQPDQQTFASPQAAVNALVSAVRADDQAALLRILGRDARRIVSSGDPVEDAHSRANFVQRYRQMHRLVSEPDGTTTMYIGAENWPMPIPLARAKGSWYFDTDAAKREILYRRIGRNELSAIRVCEELAAAEKEYRSTRDQYAAKIMSDPGRHNGLYWKPAAGQPRSPIGPLVASAVTAGYASGGAGAPTPYRGYHFHVLERQGPSAAGGPKSYLAGGRMTGGFAFVAYPAKYRSSGVMTFIVSADGVVYQKDLGRSTTQIAGAMKTYDPDASWQKSNVDEPAAAESPSR